MNALKNPTFFRPTSRPSSPAPPSRPDSGIGMERSRPLNRLSLNSFRRPSPAPSPQPSPVPATLVQDGSYLEMLSLKLSEAVSKALAPPTGPAHANEQVSGRRPIPSGRGQALGALIKTELTAATGNAHLQRAILRTLHRPLSVLLGNLGTLLLPTLSSPAFQSLPTLQATGPNPTQLHALAISGFAGELLETFDELGLGLDSDPRGDGLKSIRDGLASVINRVVNPLVLNIRSEVHSLVDALETPVTTNKSVAGQKNSTLHPSIVTLQSITPIYAQNLKRYIGSSTNHALMASFVISVVWRGVIALSHRQAAFPTPPGSPLLHPTGATKKRRGSPSTTPPATPPASRFNIKLPTSRPPSPQNNVSSMPPSPSPTVDARALYDLLQHLPLPDPDKEATSFAREAVDEAMSALRALATLFEVALNFAKPAEGRNVTDQAHELESITEQIPTLIALPVLLQAHGGVDARVSSILGLPEDEYRNGCLSGFGRADQCASAVGQRVCEYLQTAGYQDSVLLAWLESEIEED
ncbi:hypothetical protein K435DRAFT_960357 [Dendrothele bispora CBS 962.96]|uniref:Uncharacterized protein n=1 Tax=Dendrothele bispora (strain CBS 962.96) TaxID=1314807 RepID=A0A4S8MU67_DENBC|nr:hypothetical protein K435DRAFT_960357 [Dendrothele bispora CBS 962.96]